MTSTKPVRKRVQRRLSEAEWLKLLPTKEALRRVVPEAVWAQKKAEAAILLRENSGISNCRNCRWISLNSKSPSASLCLVTSETCSATLPTCRKWGFREEAMPPGVVTIFKSESQE